MSINSAQKQSTSQSDTLTQNISTLQCYTDQQTVLFSTTKRHCIPTYQVEMQFSVEQRTCLVHNYWRTGSYVAAQLPFQTKYPDSPVPHKSTINRLSRKLCQDGDVQNRKHNRKSTVLTHQKLAEVQLVLEEAPHTSLAKLR